MRSVLEELESRGLVQDTTDRDTLARRLSSGSVGVYHGIDPTASSLHLGNLIGVLVLRRFQRAGHRPIALVGGATGMVGDPSGRSDERNLLDEDTLAANLAGIRGQLQKLLDFDGDAELVNNYDWTRHLTLIEFLRETGKHATVNQMAAKHSVRTRMESDTGISFTEFTYMLLQAYDFWWLHAHRNCELQIGGSDQWGNITAGVDLIRRRSGAQVHGLTWPLLTRSDGAKFGKTADGAVWLDPARTSTYRFHQYFVQVADEDVEQSLLRFTMLPVGEIADLVEAHQRDPGRREAQRVLANEVTSLVHGPAAAAAAEKAARILFGSPIEDMDEFALEAVAAEVPTSDVFLTPGAGFDAEVPTSDVFLAPGAGFDAESNSFDLVELLVAIGLASSKGDARRGLAEGSVYVNNQRVSGSAPLVAVDRLLHGRYLLLRRGKRRHHLLRVLSGSGPS
ncbi:tyrosine--tRNA ligase [Candidatus Poriferisocius sp.]|uniref:tyrosine--tRNA ligase n=1 Tax=Candidatus Poriferisocius sp. TaxID=3101276 RepID=UPI003B01604E